MDLEVDSESKLPDTQNIFYLPFKNIKVSFILLLSLVIIIYIVLFSIVNKGGNTNGTSGKSYSILALELFLWVALIVVLYVNIKNYNDENYDFQTSIKNLLNSKMTEMDVKVSENNNNKCEQEKEKEKEKEKEQEQEKEKDTVNDAEKEVFHIPSNTYTYKQAHDMCKTLNARLATYDEVERAYNNGANWCSYGWSEDQLALFPTQKKVYNELKKIKGHKNDCGRPGINGGFMANPHIKFGVNCFGKKPKKNAISDTYMHSINHSPAINEDDLNSEDEMKKTLEEMLIAPFNKDKWSTF